MIKDQKTITINATPDQVFTQLEKDPFPTFRIFNTKPFLFLRMALIDGLGTGLKIASSKNLDQTMDESLEIGSTLGPFTLVENKRPSRYFFDLNARFFNCQTGYLLTPKQSGTLVSFDVLTENPSFWESVWWFFIKPIHAVLARKVLENTKREVELLVEREQP